LRSEDIEHKTKKNAIGASNPTVEEIFINQGEKFTIQNRSKENTRLSVSSQMMNANNTGVNELTRAKGSLPNNTLVLSTICQKRELR